MKDIQCPQYLLKRLHAVWRYSNRRIHHDTSAVASESQNHTQMASYEVIEEVLQSLDDVEAQELDENLHYQPQQVNKQQRPLNTILADTLYRYLVLVSGFQDSFQTGFITNELYMDNPVYIAIVTSLGLGDYYKYLPPASRSSRAFTEQLEREKQDREKCMKQYKQDCRRWAIGTGNHVIIKE